MQTLALKLLLINDIEPSSKTPASLEPFQQPSSLINNFDQSLTKGTLNSVILL